MIEGGIRRARFIPQLDQIKELTEIEVKLEGAPDRQTSLTDPDAGPVKTLGTGIIGLNHQTAADSKHHLIVTHENTNVGPDIDQLSGIAWPYGKSPNKSGCLGDNAVRVDLANGDAVHALLRGLFGKMKSAH